MCAVDKGVASYLLCGVVGVVSLLSLIFLELVSLVQYLWDSAASPYPPP